MATRRFKISVGEVDNAVIEEAGAAVNSDTIELTVEMATTAVNAGGSTRAPNKREIIEGLEKIRTAILQSATIPS
jgi:hypothetical protein